MYTFFKRHNESLKNKIYNVTVTLFETNKVKKFRIYL